MSYCRPAPHLSTYPEGPHHIQRPQPLDGCTSLAFCRIGVPNDGSAIMPQGHAQGHGLLRGGYGSTLWRVRIANVPTKQHHQQKRMKDKGLANYYSTTVYHCTYYSRFDGTYHGTEHCTPYRYRADGRRLINGYPRAKNCEATRTAIRAALLQLHALLQPEPLFHTT